MQELNPGNVTEDDLTEKRWLAVTTDGVFGENTNYWNTGLSGNSLEPKMIQKFKGESGKDLGFEMFPNALEILNNERENYDDSEVIRIEVVDESNVPKEVAEQ